MFFGQNGGGNSFFLEMLEDFDDFIQIKIELSVVPNMEGQVDTVSLSL